MKKEFKQKWIDELRSGKYKQCFGVIKMRSLCGDGHSFCALGVLKESVDSQSDYIHCLSEMEYCKIVELNDKFSQNFNQIADYIEANF